MRKVFFILILLALATPLRAAEPENFLLLLDTSRALARQSVVLQQTVVELANTGIYGRMQRGDRLIVWTFNEKILPAKIPVQVWTPESRRAVALNTVSYVEKFSFEKQAHLDKVFPDLLERLKTMERVTVIVVSDGGAVIFGTPFDRELNVFYGTNHELFKKSGWLFLTSFIVRHGVPEAWSVNANGDRIMLPNKDAAQSAPPTTAGTPPLPEKTPPSEPAGQTALMKETSSGAHANLAVLPAEIKPEASKHETPKTPPVSPVTTTAAITAPATGIIDKTALSPGKTTLEKAVASPIPAEKSRAAEKLPASLSQKSSTTDRLSVETRVAALAKLDATPAKLESSRPQVDTPAPPPPAAKKMVVPAEATPVKLAAPAAAPAPATPETAPVKPVKALVAPTAPEKPAKPPVPQKTDATRDVPPSQQTTAPPAGLTPAQTAVVTPPEHRNGMHLALGLGLLALAGGGAYLLVRARSTPRPSLISRSMRRDRR